LATQGVPMCVGPRETAGFEEGKYRNPIISYGTAVMFGVDRFLARSPIAMTKANLHTSGHVDPDGHGRPSDRRRAGRLSHPEAVLIAVPVHVARTDQRPELFRLQLLASEQPLQLGAADVRQQILAIRQP
jgi:hypothetical protein